MNFLRSSGNQVQRHSKRFYVPHEGPKYLITGAQGFLGSWIIKNLIQQGKTVVGVDLSTSAEILKQICTPDELEKVKLAHLNITDFEAIKNYFMHYEPSHIIHLAGAQIPTCKSHPHQGALINVVGTANIFHAAKQCEKVKSIT
eukprot:UN26012